MIKAAGGEALQKGQKVQTSHNRKMLRNWQTGQENWQHHMVNMQKYLLERH